MLKRFFQFVIVVLLLSVVGLLSAVTTMHFAIHGAEVTVPDFRGLTEADAMRKAAAMDLNFTVDDRFYSANVPAGRILTQSPLPATRVRREWQVRTTQSLGPQKVAIPSVLAQPERLATIEIRRVGLQVGTIAQMPFGGAPPNQVIAQIPSAGSAKVERPTVALLLSTSASYTSSSYVMPDLVNASYAAASANIAHTGLDLAPPDYKSVAIPDIAGVGNSGGAMPAAPVLPTRPGTILAQSPAAGARIDAHTAIHLTVAR